MKDKRDMRDPQAFGILLMELRQQPEWEDQQVLWHDQPLHVIADYIENNCSVLDYRDCEVTLAKETMLKYQHELYNRAKSGDRYAISMIDGYPFKEPGDG